MSLSKFQGTVAGTVVGFYVCVHAAAIGSDPANPVTDTPPAGVFSLVVASSATASQAPAEVSVMNVTEGEDYTVLPRIATWRAFRDNDA